jgi:peptide/nickel transport system substrate-binding protein
MRRLKIFVFLTLALTLVVGLTPASNLSPVRAQGFNEAPMLAELVQSGQLPAVEERIPSEPFVVTPFSEVGTYGGELRFGFTGGSPAWGGLLYLAGWENLMAWKPDFSGVVPNILASLEANEDASVWTATVREGMKWSDGAPFTADDIAFYIEDFLMNEELNASGFGADWVPTDMAADFQFEQVDEMTVRFIFPRSYGTFPLILAMWQGRQFAMYPKHFLEQYHAEYNPDIDALVTEEGAENWMSLFMTYAPANWGDPDMAFFRNPEYPTLGPWRVVEPLGTGTTIRLERNPYYWKVDSEGNQLPYVDTLVGIQYQDDQARTLAMLSGELDFLKDPTNDTLPQFVEVEDQGNIVITRVLTDAANGYVLQFNMSHPSKGEVFSDINFRIGVSHAINRPEMIELFNQGLGYPSQVCPLPESPLYVEACNNQYIEYDVALANEYLDKVLPNKDSDGMRLGPDGEPFNIVLIVINNWSWAPNNTQIGEKTIEYLRAVGLNVSMNAMPDTQFEPVAKANEVEAFISTGEGGAGLTALLDARNYVPMEQFGHYGTGWWAWLAESRGTPGITGAVEPPQWVLDVRQMYNDALSEPTEAGQIEKMRAVIEEATERFYQIGGYQGAEGWYPWSVRMGNVGTEWYGGWIQGVFKIQYPEQWYVKS